ncbi:MULTISPECIES: isoprenyl transferase [Prochlorococcus]|uniref:Isoprenyl transferase n=1 Tax=Prochlorococcus marinus (strain SARG / CCMP1375 / SS120) TaxID=167539 RepID=ISPT_PROMA|nr:MULTISPECIES: isoprenyl transferase [Prochlorococcus]Q7VBI9.1 RecName: Full=Isoprenyl transferase [Prochlorococcus marinus subsp. marinus str. CCMP1375]AAQ00148.1 Undecaprenyl pyrophosphate synthase [Prochlorococcus marinus subsp. marinus str. CCMP1375]KGG13944.1 Undecaprenyl diphosphate synthase [Prochlorococcus marinus str. LG]KGG19077.1 Undecaprenyl diphosphate synthase [Prochlorococcus marinus str. SS2]KGG23383.1 Undecaprenyl diphosphate synthase [Prochlorococcus marinus str. SS35]KGG3
MKTPIAIGAEKKSLITPLPASIDPLRLPEHIAIIMDGNGRWANAKKLPRAMGHSAGVDALKQTLRLCNDWGIGVLTVYAFSTENWSRPKEEVNFLMTLFERVLKKELEALNLEEVQISFLGDLDQLPTRLQDLINEATELTSGNNGIRFNVCTNYGGRRELVLAAQKLAQRVLQGDLDPSFIDEHTFAGELLTSSYADPDLLIRTSGEMRISNFLLWQLAYAEIHVTDTLWPDFDSISLTKALIDYQSRRRRFGGVDPTVNDYDQV